MFTVPFMRDNLSSYAAVRARMLSSGKVCGKSIKLGCGGRMALRVLDNQIMRGMSHKAALREAINHGNEKYGKELMQMWHKRSK